MKAAALLFAGLAFLVAWTSTVVTDPGLVVERIKRSDTYALVRSGAPTDGCRVIEAWIDDGPR